MSSLTRSTEIFGPDPGKRRPSDAEERRALEQGVDQWRQLWRDCGYKDVEVDQELEWAGTLSRRCEESGLEGHQIIKDMCDFVEAKSARP